MTRPLRWWETGERTIEHEEAELRSAGGGFALDRDLRAQAEVVVFRGELRYGSERCQATVVYPPAYSAGEHPAVFAPGMPVTRHKRGMDGLLCLDHPVFGHTDPMTGAEAVERAEELWRLSIEDPDELRRQEVDGPEPHADDYFFEESSAVFLMDADVSGIEEGWIRVGANNERPFRAALEGLGADQPNEELAVGACNRFFGGPASICGFWRRVGPRPPGPDAQTLAAWAVQQHGDLVDNARRFARLHGHVTRKRLPALVAFVFRDESSERGQFEDAWVLLLLDDDGSVRLPRPLRVDEKDRWTRQPQLEPLGSMRVAVVGAGALGSQTAALLARAGVGGFFVVDPDYVSPGMVVRHQLDFQDVGISKVQAMQRKIVSINPYAECGGAEWRYGNVRGVDEIGTAREVDDEVSDRLSECHLIVNASVSIPTGYYVSSLADAAERPVLHEAVSNGAWAARILLQRRGHSGCLECLARHQEEPVDESPTVPDWAEDPDMPEVLERGCAHPTFTGPGFELATAAAAAARCGIQLLLGGTGYPAASFDLATLSFRDSTVAEPATKYTRLPRHPACTTCHE